MRKEDVLVFVDKTLSDLEKSKEKIKKSGKFQYPKYTEEENIDSNIGFLELFKRIVSEITE